MFEDLLVEAPLGRPDVADPLEQLVEVVGVARTWRVLQPLVVHREALDEELRQARVGPLAELRAAGAADAEADGEDGVEVVVLDLAGDGTLTLGSNYSMASNSCLRRQLPLGVDLLQVVVHRPDADVEERWAMSACVSQTVSPSKRHSMRVRPSSVW